MLSTVGLYCLLLCCLVLGRSVEGSSVKREEGYYSRMNGRECIQACQSRCAGICYLNVMAYKYICSCPSTRLGK
ncbi:hypothetical protein BgiMline_034711 [Biomphalaria glabrata]|nr:hypothetical protein BgiMline_029294 [Biomphalaria glabrata]